MSIEFHPPECCTFITCEFINIYEFTQSSLTNYFIWQLHTGSAWFREILIKSRVNWAQQKKKKNHHQILQIPTGSWPVFTTTPSPPGRERFFCCLMGCQMFSTTVQIFMATHLWGRPRMRPCWEGHKGEKRPGWEPDNWVRILSRRLVSLWLLTGWLSLPNSIS